MLKGRGGFGWRVRSAPQCRGELRVHAAGEAKDHFSEVFLGSRVAAAPDHLLRVDAHKRLKRKVSLPDENGAGFRIVDQAQEGDRSGLQFERAYIHGHLEPFAAT